MRRFITICLVLLLCAPAVATKIADADDSTAIAVVDTVVDALALTNADILAMAGVGTGNVWYVDSAASGSGTAADWTNADVTIELALVHCTANAGDVIVCAPYHAETASPGTFDLDLDGVKLIGLGEGDAMTTITYDGATDTCILGATGDGCTIRNIKFYTATDNIASAIVVEDGCTDYVIEDCVFEATTTDEFLDTIYIHGTAANNGIIRRNKFLGDSAENSAPQACIGFEDAHYLRIYDNLFTGDAAVAHIENKTTASNFVSIHDNEFHLGAIGDAKLDTTPAVTLVATTTGFVYNNVIATNVANPPLSIVADDCHVRNNIYSEVQGSYLEPGKIYSMSMTSVVTATTDTIATVAGGAIEIISCFGQVTTIQAGDIGNLSVTLDATAGADYDADFSIVVAAANGMLGDVYTFAAVTNAENAGVAQGNENAGYPLSWFCPAGLLIQTTSSTGTGAIKWYITFRVLDEGVTVTMG